MLYLDYSREDGEWVPNEHGGRENLEAIELLREFNVAVHEKFPGVITAAEESTAFPGVSRPVYEGGLGFTYKWNMGWMNDSLEYMHNEPIIAAIIKTPCRSVWCMPSPKTLFCRSRMTKWFTVRVRCCHKCRATCGRNLPTCDFCIPTCGLTPGKKLLFMGGELGQWTEWNHDDGPQWELLDFDTHRGIQQCVADLNKVVIENPALHQLDFTSDGFEWVDHTNGQDSTLVYLRKGMDRCFTDPGLLQLHACRPRRLPRGGSPGRSLERDLQ